MKSFIQLERNERQLYINEAANLLGRSPIMVEKDFWVSWILGQLFSNAEIRDVLVFKGGTSLSKIYNAIERFSEDIDLSIYPSHIGFPEIELEEAPSKKQTKKRTNALKRACAEYVKTEMKNIVFEIVSSHLGNGNWVEFRDGNPPFLLFKYPSALTVENSYLTPYVKLEFSSLSDQQPIGEYRIQSMISEALPGTIEEQPVKVIVLEVERTFWEKATILHAEYYRVESDLMPARYARHYADLANLCRHSAKQKALKRLDLLERTAYHKERFFRASWASYSTARPGTLQLVPPEYRIDDIRRDYIAMKEMYYGTPLTLDKVFDELRALTEEINSST